MGASGSTGNGLPCEVKAIIETNCATCHGSDADVRCAHGSRQRDGFSRQDADHEHVRSGSKR